MALSVNHPAARKLWSLDLSRVVPQNSFFYQNEFIKPESEGDSAVIVEMDELMASRQDGKSSGFQINYDLDGPLIGYTTPGDKQIKGKEKLLTLFEDNIQINQDRFSVKSEGKFAEQLVPYSYRDRARNRLAQFWPLYFDERLICKLSGSVGDGTWFSIDPTQSSTGARDVEGSVASDGNDLRAVSGTNRAVYGAADNTQANLATTDKLSLDLLDAALLKAVRPENNSTLHRLMNPLMLDGVPSFVFMSDYVTAKDMGQATSGRWYDIERAKVQGGMKDSRLLKGSLGVYKSPVGVNVILYSHPKMVKFSSATTGSVKAVRNLLLGQSAGRIAYGRESEKLPNFSWHEETDNRGNELVITAGTVVGIQKCAFATTETGTTREDWGVIAVDTYGNW